MDFIMAKFNVGDYVEFVGGGLWGEIKNGERGWVLSLEYDDTMAVQWEEYSRVRHDCDGKCTMGYGWYIETEEATLIESKNNKSIHITVKGDTVHAVYKNGDEVINRTVAKCHPDDKFDFEIGAKLAFNRLMNDGGEMGMKASEVMVFSKFRFIEIYGVEEYKPNAIWVDKWHGKTEREMLDNGYRTLPEWFVPEGEVSPS